MNFLNAILLGGGAALVAPLVIHLLNRSKFQVVDWGAMHLLESALQANTRRIQWESLLLLAIRCLIPVLLAFTLARPVLTQSKSAGTGGAESLILLLDNTSSMAAANDAGSLLSRAIEQLETISSKSPATELAAWSTSTPMQQLARTQIAKLQAAGTSSPTEAFMHGLRELQLATNPSRQLVLISDFQASQWRALPSRDHQTIKQQAAAPAVQCQIFLLPVSSKKPAENLAVQLVDARSYANLNDIYQISARVHNYSPVNATNIRVVFQVDGLNLASRSISLVGGASEQLDFACSFSQLGQHAVAIHIEDPSSVHDDDWCFAVVNVAQQPRIILVDNQSNHKSFVGNSRFLQLALAPFEDANQNPFRIEVLDTASLTPKRLAQADAVILASIDNWRIQNQQALEQFVSEGGGLLVFAQASFAPNATKPNHSFERLLPRAFGQERSVSSESAIGVLAPVSTNSSLRFLSLPQSGIESIRCTNWLKLTEPPAAQGPAYEVLLEFANGDPFIASHRFEKGIVLQCATSCSDDDSNLPREPVFVPLMLSLAEILIHHADERTIYTTGESIAFRGDDVIETSEAKSTTSLQPSPTSSATIELVQPQTGTERAGSFEVPIENGQVVFGQTHRPGLYRWRTPSELENGAKARMFSVSIPDIESDLEPLSKEELERIASSLGADVIYSPEQFTSFTKLRRDGWEMWRWLLVGVLVLLFFEQWLGMRFTRGAA